MSLFTLTPIFTRSRRFVATMVVLAPIERSDGTYYALSKGRSSTAYFYACAWLGISIRTTVAVMNLCETPQKALQTFWAQDFTAK